MRVPSVLASVSHAARTIRGSSFSSSVRDASGLSRASDNVTTELRAATRDRAEHSALVSPHTAQNSCTATHTAHCAKKLYGNTGSAEQP